MATEIAYFTDVAQNASDMGMADLRTFVEQVEARRLARGEAASEILASAKMDRLRTKQSRLLDEINQVDAELVEMLAERRNLGPAPSRFSRWIYDRIVDNLEKIRAELEKGLGEINAEIAGL